MHGNKEMYDGGEIKLLYNDDTNKFIEIFDDNKDLLIKENKEKYGQYFSGKKIAEYMANMFNKPSKSKIKLLDPGCGVGILTAAFLERLLQINENKVKTVLVTMYEIDESVIEKLKHNMKQAHEKCKQMGLEVKYIIKNENFIKRFSSMEDFNSEKYDYVIMNPPYMKLPVESDDNRRLQELGIKVPNYYAAFVSLAKRLLVKKGELVAITPRSFCNGAYFLEFRQDFLSNMAFDKIHLFESRTDVFKEDEVLQENIIFHCIKKEHKSNDKISIWHTYGDSFEEVSVNEKRFEDIVFPNDNNLIIRILKDNEESEISRKINSLACKLEDLNIQISTGPVVDFREPRDIQSKERIENSIPFFFSEHLSIEGLKWPKNNVKKYNYIRLNSENRSKMRPNGNYVLVKRMTSKEEKRRIVSSLCVGDNYDYEYFAFDNKVNYFHINKEGVPIVIAKGLVIFLNSTIVDRYFRTFSGNTQVNATDLKSLNYPTELQLQMLGEEYEDVYQEQELIDKVIEEILFS